MVDYIEGLCMASDEITSVLTPLLNTAQSRAASAYKTNSYQGLSQRELMVRIYQKTINHLYVARDAHLANELEQMVEQNGKAIHILDVLREELIGSDALKDPEAANGARYLIKAYGDWIIRITNVLQQKPVVNEFNAIIDEIKDVYKAWMPPKPAEGEVSAGEAVPMNISTSS